MSKEWIPNINIGQDYDSTYRDASIHFDKLGKLADFFGRDMPMHLHADYCQIHYIQTGNTLFNIDQNSFATQGGAVFYTPASTPHAFLTEPEAPGYVLTAHTSLIQTFLDRLDRYSNNNLLLMPICLAQQSLKPDEWQPVASIFELMMGEWRHQSDFKLEALESLFEFLLIQLLRLADTKSPRYQHTHGEVVTFREFSQLVEKHFVEQKQLTWYCEALNINENRLNYICRKIAQVSPKKIINGRNLLEAKRLLSHTNMNLTEIAYTLGYLDPSYFSRFFIKHTAMTPSEFRRTHRTL